MRLILVIVGIFLIPLGLMAFVPDLFVFGRNYGVSKLMLEIALVGGFLAILGGGSFLLSRMEIGHSGSPNPFVRSTEKLRAARIESGQDLTPKDGKKSRWAFAALAMVFGTPVLQTALLFQRPWAQIDWLWLVICTGVGAVVALGPVLAFSHKISRVRRRPQLDLSLQNKMFVAGAVVAIFVYAIGWHTFWAVAVSFFVVNVALNIALVTLLRRMAANRPTN